MLLWKEEMAGVEELVMGEEEVEEETVELLVFRWRRRTTFNCFNCFN